MMKGKTTGPKLRRRRQVPAKLAKAELEFSRSSSASDLHVQMENVSLLSSTSSMSESLPPPQKKELTIYEKLCEAEAAPDYNLSSSVVVAGMEEGGGDDKDCILSQDFFCTPDYITPDGQQICNNFQLEKENIVCPKSPEKSITGRNKRYRKEVSPCNSLSVYLPCHQQDMNLEMETSVSGEAKEAELIENGSHRKPGYVSQSAVALRCRVMPPPCIKNPYLAASVDLDIFEDRRPKCIGYSPLVGGDNLSRYRTDFQEIEQIGYGNFSRVFKVLKRIDGCMYAVKQSIRQLRHDKERVQALMEVQALAALGYHENVVGYYTSWFENEHLFIQMELCDHSLSVNKTNMPTGVEVFQVLYQIARALQFLHEHGVAHMDVKPENIYVKNGVYKLGDFGCATLINRSVHIEEGDARYMPQEILNDRYEHLDRVDIFSLGASIYELLKGSPLPDSGPQFCSLREGKIALLPGCPMQFQGLIKAMMDPDPIKRPSARDIIENPLFDKALRSSISKLSCSGYPTL